MTASRYDFGLRLMVAEKDARRRASRALRTPRTMLAGSGTCSRSSMQVTTSKRPGSRSANASARDGFVVHRETRLEQVQLRDLERLLGQVDARHARARARPSPRRGSRRRIRRQARAFRQAALFRSIHARRSGLISCSGRNSPCGIPPAVRELAEFRELIRVCVDAGLDHVPPAAKAARTRHAAVGATSAKLLR